MRCRSPLSLLALALSMTSTSGVHVRSNDWQVPVFRAAIDLVNLGVTVTDRKGVLATDLTADDFDIYEDGKKQAVRYFAAGEASNADRPSPEMHLGLLLDVSQSMVEDIGFTRTAAIKFLNALERDPVLFLITGIGLGEQQGGMVRLQVGLETYVRSGI